MSNPTVLLETTEGDILIELFEDKAPITVANFLEYVDDGSYDNTIFHRVIKNFMIQGGGMTMKLQYKGVPPRPSIRNEATNGLKNVRGTVAMARTSDPHSATNQFFINTVDNAYLDFTAETIQGYGYCVFGKVIDGMDVVDKISNVKTRTVGGHADVPVDSIVILSAKRFE